MLPSTTRRADPFRRLLVRRRKETIMDDKDKAETDRKQREAQKKLDETPPPGTDPLHEGP